jgi:hypothetical protein
MFQLVYAPLVPMPAKDAWHREDIDDVTQQERRLFGPIGEFGTGSEVTLEGNPSRNIVSDKNVERSTYLPPLASVPRWTTSPCPQSCARSQR